MEDILKEVFSFWEELDCKTKEEIKRNIVELKYKKGKILAYDNNEECSGPIIMKEGQARVFINSENGNEFTVFRLLNNDMCILSATCMIKNLEVNSNIEFEKDSIIYKINPEVFDNISNKNPQIKEFVLNLVSEKFSDVMWLFSHYIFSSMPNKVANALIEYRALVENNDIKITHDTIAKDIGSAREVVSRILKQFSKEGIVEMSRGKITIKNYNKLKKIAK